MISAGRLKYLATVYTASASQDVLGLRDDTFVAASQFRVDMRSESAAESQYADGVAVLQTYELRARWQAWVASGCTTLDRLNVRGHTLRITGVQNLNEADRVAIINVVEVE
jgi:head-tail adaptor